MNQMNIRKVAILVDGGFYRKRAAYLWDKNASAASRADELFRYCMLHISEPDEPRDLYRIFYYDCPPLKRDLVHPLTGEPVNYAESERAKWTYAFFEALSKKRKVAMRMGELAEQQAHYSLRQDVLEDLLSGGKQVSDLKTSDFSLVVSQKGVDMRIGLDVASLAHGRYVDQIVLISGDSDFVPVAKMARRNGIDFILDPLGQHIKKNLSEHIDGMETFTARMNGK